MRRIDDTGKTFNRLTAIRDVETGPHGRLCEYLCSCGNVVTKLAKKVRSGQTKSCGCIQRERHNPPTIPPEKIPALEQAFWSHVGMENRPEPVTCRDYGPCMLWTGRTNPYGRAQMSVGNRTIPSSHVSWFLRYGVWPFYLCHRCDDRKCVNPEHLFEGDNDINQYDRMAKREGGVMVP